MALGYGRTLNEAWGRGRSAQAPAQALAGFSGGGLGVISASRRDRVARARRAVAEGLTWGLALRNLVSRDPPRSRERRRPAHGAHRLAWRSVLPTGGGLLAEARSVPADGCLARVHAVRVSGPSVAALRVGRCERGARSAANSCRD